MSSSLEASGKPSWFVQILFGRYRSFGAIQWTHLAVIGVVAFVMVRTGSGTAMEGCSFHFLSIWNSSLFDLCSFLSLCRSLFQLYTYLYFLRRKFNHYSRSIAELPQSVE